MAAKLSRYSLKAVIQCFNDKDSDIESDGGNEVNSSESECTPEQELASETSDCESEETSDIGSLKKWLLLLIYCYSQVDIMVIMNLWKS